MTDKDNTYNGWANRATWNVALWLGNDEPMYRDMRRFARNQGALLTSERAKDYCQSVFGEKTRDGYKLSEVDWDEIATMMKEEVE